MSSADARTPQNPQGLTLHELETYFAIEIVEGYHQRIHSGLQRPPIAVWREAIAATPLRMPKDRMAFWVSFLPEARRKLGPMASICLAGALSIGMGHWRATSAERAAMFSLSTIRATSRESLSAGHRDISWWRSGTILPGRLCRSTSGTINSASSAARPVPSGIQERSFVVSLGKRSLIERAKRLTHEASKKHLPLPKKAVDDSGLGSLKGVDSSTPVPGEE